MQRRVNRAWASIRTLRKTSSVGRGNCQVSNFPPHFRNRRQQGSFHLLDVCYPDYVRVPSVCLVETLELLVLHVAVGSVLLGIST